MKYLNIIVLSFKKIFKSANSIVSIILTTIVVSILLFSVSFNLSLSDYWKNTIRKTIDYRTLLVAFDPEKIEEKDVVPTLLQYDNVEEVAPYTSYLITMQSNDFYNDKKANAFFLVGTIDQPVQIDIGEDLSRYNSDDKVMICAKQFYPYSENDEADYVLDNSIDLSKKVGDELSLSFIGSDKEEKFKLVGVYDSEKSNVLGDTCYTKWETVENLNLEYQKEVYEYEEGEYPSFVIVLNDVANVDNFIQQITDDGFATTGPVVKINTILGDELLNKITIVTLISFLLMGSVIVANSVRNVEINKMKYGLMKVFGFSSKNLMQMCFWEELIKYLFSYILTMPLCIFIIKCFSQMFLKNKLLLNGFSVNITVSSLLITFAITLIIPIIVAYITSTHIRKVEITKMLRD